MATLAFAAAGVALEIVSMIPDGIALVEMLQDKIAPPFASTQDTVVRVHLGSQADKDDANNLGGDVPGAALWDMNGSLIGSKKGRNKKLRQGAFEDIIITAREEVGNVQAHYLGISNGGIDAICIAGIAVTFPDGATTGFSGNLPKMCGAPWANSNTPVAQALAGNGQPTNDCVWIDGNNSNDLPYQGFGLHLPSFGAANTNLVDSYREDDRLMCKSGPRFRMYEKLTSNDPILVFPKPPRFLISEEPGTNATNIGRDADPSFIIENPGIEGDRPDRRKKRSAHTIASTVADEGNGLIELSISKDSQVVRRSYPPPSIGSRSSGNITNFATGPGPSSIQPTKKFMYSKVVVSPHEYNSAKRLCESDTSWGQSFVSLSEGLFCDMQDKTLYYTCENDQAPSSSNCCYDTTQDNLLACTPELNKRDGTMTFHMPISSLMIDINAGTTTQGMVEGKVFTDVKHWQAV